MASIGVLPAASLRRKYARPSVSWRSWTTAMMCSARLMRRLPARDSRWRCWSPEEASSGAVPFHDAKWLRLAKRVMSPMSPSRRADPVESSQPAAGSGDERGQRRVGLLDLLVDYRELGDEIRGELTAGPSDHITGTHGGQDRAGLGCGQVLLRPAGNQIQQQGVQPVDGVSAGPAQPVAAVDHQA